MAAFRPGHCPTAPRSGTVSSAVPRASIRHLRSASTLGPRLLSAPASEPTPRGETHPGTRPRFPPYLPPSVHPAGLLQLADEPRAPRRSSPHAYHVYRVPLQELRRLARQARPRRRLDPSRRAAGHDHRRLHHVRHLLPVPDAERRDLASVDATSCGRCRSPERCVVVRVHRHPQFHRAH